MSSANEVVGCVAGAVENLTGLDRLRRSIGAQARELGITQPRKSNRIFDVAFSTGAAYSQTLPWHMGQVTGAMRAIMP